MDPCYSVITGGDWRTQEIKPCAVVFTLKVISVPTASTVNKHPADQLITKGRFLISYAFPSNIFN